MNNEIKLHQALGEMKAVAKQLYPLYKALTDEIEQLPEEDPDDPITTKKTLKYLSDNIFDLGTRLTDNAKAIEKDE